MISRTGHAALRKALYIPGLVALRHNPILQVFGARMKTNGLAPKAVVGAAMRKLAHLIYGVVKSGKPFDVTTLSTGLQFKMVSDPVVFLKRRCRDLSSIGCGNVWPRLAPRLNGLLTALAVLPSLEDDAARRRLAHYGRVVKKRVAVWTSSGSLDALHALRRLRYAREWQGLDTADLKTWQETLGRVSDLRFTLDYVSGGWPRAAALPA